jgi:predicted O-methyltransferase YrrM
MSADQNQPRWKMSGLLNADVEQYVYSLLPERDAVLTDMERYAAEHEIPIVGPAVGRMLHLLARLANARSVFEAGSAIGYSTIWWARAVGESGRVTYTDNDPENARRARASFERAGVADRIQIEVGDSLEILARQTQPFDIVFNDVDKEAYPRVLAMADRHVREGGMYVVDNTLWSGRVTRKIEANDKSTAAIVEHNNALAKSAKWFSSLIPLRDGVTVAVRS